MNSRLPTYLKHSLLTVAISVAVAGCSGQSFPGSQLLGGQQNAYVPPKIKALKPVTASVKTLWQVKTASSVSSVRIHPYVNDVAVYTASGGTVSAWNKTTGRALWSNPVGELISAGVNGGEGKVYVGTRSGKALALDANTGKILWIAPLGTEALAVSESSNGNLALRTIDGKLFGLDSNTGEQVWVRQQRTPQLSSYGASVPIIVDNGIIAGFDNGKVAAYLLKTGKPIWEVTIATPQGGSELDQIVDVDGRLKPLGNALFTSSINGRILGANMVNGNVVWSDVLSSYTGADADTKGVYSTDATGRIWKYGPLNGQKAWDNSDLENRQPTAPTIVAGGSRIVVGDRQGNLHWLDTTNGQIVSRTTGDPAGYQVPVAVSGNTLFAFGRSGVLTALSNQ